MPESEVKKNLELIEQANADIYRISVILRLCNEGMRILSDYQVKHLPFTAENIGDALNVLGDDLERLHNVIDEARSELE